MSGAYYNEIDPVAAEWLRRLIVAGLIADGEVDERDMRDVTPDELAGFVQCHFFAGIGIWSGALRAAGWRDDEPIWTGSCPCQPFSAAGAREGVDDERHLWPHWHWLVEQRRPRILVGEQVAGKDGLGWNDLVSADLAASGYAFASVNLCAGGFGLEWRRSAYATWLERALHDCPDPMVARQLRNFADWAGESLSVGGLHIRQRQYFVGVADEQSRGRGVGGHEAQPGPSRYADRSGGPSGGLSDLSGQRCGEGAGLRGGESGGDRGLHAPDNGPDGGLYDAASPRRDASGRGLAGEVEGDGRLGRSLPSVGRRDDGLEHGVGEGLERLGGDGLAPDQRGRDAGTGPRRSAAEAGEPSGLADAGRGVGQRGPENERRSGQDAGERLQGSGDDQSSRGTGGLADDRRGGLQSGDGAGGERGPAGGHEGAAGQRERGGQDDTAGRASGGLGDHGGRGCDEGEPRDAGTAESPRRERGDEPDRPSGADRPGQADERRSPFDWLLCRDGVWRAARPGTLPLAHAVAGRVGKLRAYENSIDFETAVAFCEAVKGIMDDASNN